MGGALSLDVGGVDRGAFRHRPAGGQRLQKPDPEPAAGPAVEAVVDRRGRPVFGRTVAPPAAGLEHVDDA